MGQTTSVFRCSTVSQLKNCLGKPKTVKRLAQQYNIYTWDRFHAYVKVGSERVVMIREFRKNMNE